MSSAAITAIITKDLRQLSRDKFWAMITLIGLVFIVGIFWVIPDDVDETVNLGLHQVDDSPFLGSVAALGTGFDVVDYASLDELRDAVAANDVQVGLDLPPGFVSSVRAGESPQVTVFVSVDSPGLAASVRGLTQEIAAALVGEPLPIALPDPDTVLVGPSGVTEPPSFRDRVRPMFAFLVLMIETFALASLVAGELVNGTARAIAVTPATVADLLVAKTVVGVAIAFTEGMALLLLTGTLGLDPPLLVVAMLLGALLVTGIGLLAGSVGGDFMTTVFVSMLFMFPLLIPAFGTMFPGSAAWWVRALPSFGLIDVVSGVALRSESWAAAAGGLLTVSAWCAALLGGGWIVLRRRLAVA